MRRPAQTQQHCHGSNHCAAANKAGFASSKPIQGNVWALNQIQLLAYCCNVRDVALNAAPHLGCDMYHIYSSIHYMRGLTSAETACDCKAPTSCAFWLAAAVSLSFRSACMPKLVHHIQSSSWSKWYTLQLVKMVLLQQLACCRSKFMSLHCAHLCSSMCSWVYSTQRNSSNMQALYLCYKLFKEVFQGHQAMP